MGVLNVTPDSFSDGGALHEEGALSLDLCLRRARQMLADGADILDIGGESTRPGAAPVPLQEEMDRVLPVVEAVAAELAPRISVDTSSPELMAEAMARGAWMINDVRALRRPGAVAVAAASGARVCLMHMQGAPDTMQLAPEYDDVVEWRPALFCWSVRKSAWTPAFPEIRSGWTPALASARPCATISTCWRVCLVYVNSVSPCWWACHENP